jgi:drug/metabolite transporter (DMT)-like permease
VGTTAQAYLRVPIGVAFGVLVLGENLSPTAWIGLGCVVLGVAAMTVPTRKSLAINASPRG